MRTRMDVFMRCADSQSSSSRIKRAIAIQREGGIIPKTGSASTHHNRPPQRSVYFQAGLRTCELRYTDQRRLPMRLHSGITLRLTLTYRCGGSAGL